jgi:hypothetical protein
MRGSAGLPNEHLREKNVTVKYLLPCSCGRKLPVELRQAGQSVVCQCGASLEVPTMLELATLAKAGEEPAASRPAMRWGRRQRVGLVGLTIVLATIGLAVYLACDPPVRPPIHPELSPEHIEDLSPVASRKAWRELRREGIAPRYPADAAYEEAVFRYRLRWGATAVLGICGTGLIVGAVAWRRRRTSSA